jgi:hypothetical protein
MKLDLIAACLLGSDFEFDKRSLNWLASVLRSDRGGVDLLLTAFEVAMRFRNRSKDVRFQNEANVGGIRAVHIVDADAKSDRYVLS